MNQSDIKNAIARCALSGITQSLEKALPGAKLTECDVCIDSPRTVQIAVKIDGWTHVYEFTVRELLA